MTTPTLTASRLNHRIRLQRRNPNTVRDQVNEDVTPWIDVANRHGSGRRSSNALGIPSSKPALNSHGRPHLPHTIQEGYIAP